MELNLYFEIKFSDLASIEESCVTFPKTFFPEPLPELLPEMRKVYEGKTEFILLGKKVPKRTFDFILDFSNEHHVNVRLYENGKDFNEQLMLVNDLDESMKEGTQAMLFMFVGNTAWLMDKLVPKVKPGKTIKGVRRVPFPPGMPDLLPFFTKAV